jgi:hypothetical protein
VSGPPTLLELVLPSGRASCRLVIGSAAPDWLQAHSGEGPADLVIVAPGPSEAGRADWVRLAVDRAFASATPQGMIYLMLPAGTRRGAMRRVRALAEGSVVPFVHQPGFARSEQLVPADRASLRRWIESGEGSSPLRRRLAAAALALPSAERIVTSALPGIGVAAFRSPSSVPFGWLARVSGRPVARAQVRAKWRGGRGGAVLTGLDHTGAPVTIVKVALGGECAAKRAVREAERLCRLGPAARQAGALVPSASLAEMPSGWPILLLQPIAGRPAASLIAAKAQPPEAVIAGLIEWLARWSAATLAPGRLEDEWIEHRLVAPATVLGADLPEAYVAWLRARADAAKGDAISSVATHGDLTMTNVLLAGASLGVVDWEAAEPEGLPLRDLLYAVVDATAARDGYRDRLAAFERCFPAGGRVAGPLGAGLDRLRHVAGLSDTGVMLCVHACWLQHAADERNKRGPEEERPFLAIVRRLAERTARGEGTL